MAANTTSKFRTIKQLEASLAQQKNDEQRLFLIDELGQYYAYTNIKKAQKLLAEQELLLKQFDYPDLLLNFYLTTALVENQLYNFYLAEQHFLKAFDIIEERGDIKQLAETYIDYSGVCLNLDKTQVAMSCLEKAKKLLNSYPDARLESQLICREGYWNLHHSNYPKAIELLLESEKRINQLDDQLTLKDYFFLTFIHSGLGRIYDRNGEKEKSVRAYLRVVQMCETMDMRTRLSWDYLNVGVGFKAIGDLTNAEVYFEKAINITDDVSQYARASAYANLGYCYFQKKEYKKALELFDRAEYLYREKSSEDYANFSVIENWRAQLFAEAGQRKLALRHFFQALDYAKQIEDYRQLSSICQDIATFYADIGDFRRAYEYRILHGEMSNKYIEEVNKHKQLELEVKYEARKKEHEAEKLRLEATKLQLKALRAQMNPHFLFNALNSIQNYITSKEVSMAAKFLSRFAKLMRQSLEYSDYEVITLEREVSFLTDYLFINAKLRFEDRLKYEIEVDEEIEDDIMGIPTMIVQPYVENAIEHGLRSQKNGLISVSFTLQEEEDIILCIVKDNGIGREKAREVQKEEAKYREYRSRGTSITEERLAILNRYSNKQLSIETIDLKDEKTGEALGTQVNIQIPVVEIKVK